MNPHVRENLQSPMTIVDRTIGRPARLNQNKIILLSVRQVYARTIAIYSRTPPAAIVIYPVIVISNFEARIGVNLILPLTQHTREKMNQYQGPPPRAPP
jgi:hypothetical protein